MTQQQQSSSRQDAEVLTPATRAGFSGAEDAESAVYTLPAAEAPRVRANQRKRRRGSSIAALDSADGSAWSQPLFGSCGAASPIYWLRVACCPCATAAAVNERLGSSFELALLYFGALASGLFVFLGLAITYDQTNRGHGEFPRPRPRPPPGIDNDWGSHDGADSSFGHGFDGGPRPSPGRDGPWPPPREADVSLGKNPQLWAGLAVVCVLLYLLGVWLLRDQTRKHLAIRGTRLGDLAVSLACSCCALGQMDLELRHSVLAKTERRRERGGQDTELETGSTALPVVTVETEAREPRHGAADTLAAYPTAALV